MGALPFFPFCRLQSHPLQRNSVFAVLWLLPQPFIEFILTLILIPIKYFHIYDLLLSSSTFCCEVLLKAKNNVQTAVLSQRTLVSCMVVITKHHSL